MLLKKKKFVSGKNYRIMLLPALYWLCLIHIPPIQTVSHSDWQISSGMGTSNKNKWSCGSV